MSSQAGKNRNKLPRRIRTSALLYMKKTWHFLCPNSLNLLTVLSVLQKFIFPLLTPCPHYCKIHLPVLSLQPSAFVVPLSSLYQGRNVDQLFSTSSDIASNYLWFWSRQHYVSFQCVPTQGHFLLFQMSSRSLSVAAQGWTTGLRSVTSGALGVA